MSKVIRKALMAAVVLVMLAGCGSSAKEDALTKITLSEVTHSLFYAPQYVAMGLGYFEEFGIQLEVFNGGGADKVMTAVMSGDAEIGLCGPEQTVYVYNQGNTNYPVTFAQLTKRDGSFIVGRESDENFTVEDFRGKHIIGGRKGGMPVMCLEYSLRMNGLIPGEDVTVDTSIAFDAMSGAFISGIGDFVTAFEPLAGNMENNGQGYVLMSLGELSGDIPYTAYNARREYIKKNPEIIRNFARAVSKGQDFVWNHTAKEIATIVAPYFADTKIEDIERVIERYKSIEAYARTTALSEKDYNHLLDVLDSAGELTARPPYTDLVSLEFFVN
ncbi:MAG: ABC transporter substrate-binding protein [Clostridiales bacterium]|nr:ABC transporter substrate-binding protein [Clostridiales bacterium]